MTDLRKAQIKGIFYMLVIAGLFGGWQNSWLAFAFMLTFLFFIEKLVRMILLK